MPHCIVLCANGLQTAYLGAYGNPWIHTPNIDRLAAEGVVFDWHFPDNLTTLPTRRSWWSGRYTFHDELLGWGPVDEPEELQAIFQLNKSGIRTAIISDCPYVNDPEMGYTAPWGEVITVRGSGYDSWCEAGKDAPKVEDEPGLRLPPADDPNFDIWKRRWTDLLLNRRRTGRLEDESKSGSGQVIEKAGNWLADHARDEKPFLLWLDLFCPHGPWDLPEIYRDYYAAEGADQFDIHETGDLISPHLEDAAEVQVLIDVPGGFVGDVLSEDELDRLRKTYAGAVTMLDTQVGRLLDQIDELGLKDRIVVIFVSDQGEPLGEHDFVRRPFATVHEELAHTPLIVCWPGAAESGQRCDALVQSVDLPPTLFDALGVKPPQDWPGMSLYPLLNDSRKAWRDHAVYGMDNETFALRTRDWLLVESIDESEEEEPDSETLSVEKAEKALYAKPKDRWEQHDLSTMYEEVVEDLSQQLANFIEDPDRKQ